MTVSVSVCACVCVLEQRFYCCLYLTEVVGEKVLAKRRVLCRANNKERQNKKIEKNADNAKVAIGKMMMVFLVRCMFQSGIMSRKIIYAAVVRVGRSINRFLYCHFYRPIAINICIPIFSSYFLTIPFEFAPAHVRKFIPTD